MTFATASTRSPLTHAWIELTYQCDLECLHCYNDSGPGRVVENPLAQHEYKELLLQLRNAECRSIQFIGGEPTLHPQLGELIDTASALGFERVEVFSNLTHFRTPLIAQCVARGVKIACSFYSDIPETHDHITGKKGSHKRTTDNIRRLISAGVQLRVAIVLMRGVNDDRLQETKALLGALGVKEVGIDDARAIGRLQMGDAGKEQILRELCGQCANGNVCIDPSGYVSPCIMSTKWKLGSVREVSVESMLSSDLWIEFATSLKTAAPARARAGIGCSPEDQCSPGACHPQIGGPPDCMPQRSCMPDVIPHVVQ